MKTQNWQELRTMDGAEFKRIIRLKKVSQAGAGRYLGFSERKGRRIVLDETPLDPAQVLLLRASVKYGFKLKVPAWVSPRKAVPK